MVHKRFVSTVNSKFLKKNYGKKVFNKSLTKSVKKKRSSVSLFYRRFRIPILYRLMRISVYTGRLFFSFLVKRKYIGGFFRNFVPTKKFGTSIHYQKKSKKKGKSSSKKK
jgi:ribosomal protein S19